MKTFLYCTIASAILLCSCHESIEKRAQREAREYTEKNCPTPVLNYMRTDSVVFETSTRTYHYYLSVMNDLDDAKIFELNRKLIVDNFMKQVHRCVHTNKKVSTSHGHYVRAKTQRLLTMRKCTHQKSTISN